MVRTGLPAWLIAVFCLAAPATAHAQETWVRVTIGCCGVNSSWKIPTQGMRGFTSELGSAGLSCQQFFTEEVSTTSYPGGLPQRDGTRNINLRALDKARVKQDLCDKMRQSNTTCCEASTLCEEACGQAARQSFNRLYAGLTPDSTADPSPQAVIDRFLSTCAAARLLEELVDMPCHWDQSPSCRMESRLKFRLRFRERQPSDLEAGSIAPDHFYPDPAGASPELLRNFVYTISITNERVQLRGGGGTLISSGFPAANDSCFNYSFSDPTSQMAATLYHELTHLWWMNRNQRDRHDSGHGVNLGSCSNYDAEFIRRLRTFYAAMDARENCAAKPAAPSKPTPPKPG